MEQNEKMAILKCSILTGLCVALVLFGIHIQIPDQEYCDTLIEYRHSSQFGAIYYQESLHRYDFSFNECKCMYNEDGKFIANPKYSIWGVRI